MSKPTFTIREAVEADVDGLLAMHAQSWIDTYPNEEFGVTEAIIRERLAHWHDAGGREKRRQKILDAQTNPDLEYWVAEDEQGKIIGLAAPHRDEKEQRLGAIYVDKAFHGSGLAQKLMEKILAWADPSRPLELEVASYNERAKAFYRTYGFVEIADSETDSIVIQCIRIIRKAEI